WRWVMLAGAAPALLALFIARYVPESERWKRSVEKASAHPLGELFVGSLGKMTLLGILFASIALIGTWGSVQWLPAWADQMTQGASGNAKGLTQLLSGLGAVLGCLIGAWIGHQLGRRAAYFLLCLASLVTCGSLFRFVHQYGPTFLLLVLLIGATTA